MSGELEAAGALTTAGLAAGALEGGGAGAAGEGACLNCGAALAGAYCSACGQAAHSHRTLLHMSEEVLHGLFHFDTKAWRTLPMLALRPGTLTRSYIYGQRARYISPLALFLFTIFLMFFVFAFVDSPIKLDATPLEQRAEATENLTEARAELAGAQRELAATRANPPEGEPAGLAERFAAQAVRLAEAEVTRREAALRLVDRLQAERAAEAAATAPAAAPAAPETWQDNLRERVRDGRVKVNSGFPSLDAQILHSLENPDLALYKIQQSAYKFSFLLVPISLPFIWLLFIWKRGLTLYDHVVFVLYSLSFASVLFVAVALCTQVAWLEWLGATLFGLGLPVHMFFHLKGAYALGWWSAIWRTTFLILFAWVSFIVFVLTIILLGLTG
jgi:hypothetical protein